MPDIRLHSIDTPDVITIDWLQSPVTGLIVEDKELITALKVAVTSDAVAAPTDILPDPRSDDLRDWWRDEDATAIWNGWPLGLKLWLPTGAKILTTGGREAPMVRRVQAYTGAALQPFVAAKIIRASRSRPGWSTTNRTIRSWRAWCSIAGGRRR
jgi:Phage protein GP46